MASNESEERKKFRKAFYKRMKSYGVPVTEIARQTGISQDAIYLWNHDTKGSVPDLHQVHLISTLALKIEAAELGFGVVAPNPDEQELLSELRSFQSPPIKAVLGMLKGMDAPRKEGVRSLEKRTKKRDRRWELGTYHLDDTGPPRRMVKGYDGVAAGPGRAFDLCADVYFVREHINAGHVYARVRGDSMMDTIRPGDVVILEEFKDPFQLEPLSNRQQKAPMARIKADVGDDTIWIVQINDDEATLKRVRYEDRAGEHNWTLMIEADNRDVWEAYPVKHTDHVRFWAHVKGLANISKRGG